MNYPDDVTQSSFDRYWNDKLDDPKDRDDDIDDEIEDLDRDDCICEDYDETQFCPHGVSFSDECEDCEEDGDED